MVSVTEEYCHGKTTLVDNLGDCVLTQDNIKQDKVQWEGRKEMFYLNDALNTFYLLVIWRLYGKGPLR